MTTLHDLFATIPARFRPEKAGTANLVVHFIFEGEIASNYQVRIAKGHSDVSQELDAKPDCVVRTKAQHYIDLELGKLNPQMALITGKVKVSSMAAMLQFTKYFRRFRAGEGAQTKVVIPTRPSRTGPLTDVVILDLSRLLPGPMATLLLAQMGADVIKIEDPASPDPIRDFPPQVDGTSVFYNYLNRGKRSFSIDLNEQKGRESFLELVKTADVVIEQFRPGVINALGIGYEVLKSVNPKIILASITGYGQNGPMAQMPGHDLNYLAWTGILDGLRESHGTPVVPAFQAADVSGGAHMAVVAILAALHEAKRTGLGRHLDVAMTDAMFHLQALRLAEEQATGQFQGQLAGKLANYNVYGCADGLFVALGALEPKFWEQFCALVNRTDWAPRMLDSNQSALISEVAELFNSKPRQHWLDLLLNQEVCLAPVLSPLESLIQPHFAARNGAEIWPVFGDGADWKAPSLGEDGP